MRPGIREDGAGRGLLRGAPTRPLARPRAQAPLKLPKARRAESLSAPRCRTQPRAAKRTACYGSVTRTRSPQRSPSGVRQLDSATCI